MKELSEAEQAKTLDLCSLHYSKDTSGGEQKTKRLIFPQSQVMWRHRLCSVAAVCTWPAAHVLPDTGESAFVLLAWGALRWVRQITTHLRTMLKCLVYCNANRAFFSSCPVEVAGLSSRL